jgi:predicted RNase H-like nuclease
MATNLCAGEHAMRAVIGLDGCRAGWVACVLRDDQTATLEVVGYPADIYPPIDCDLVCVDIPIGLADRGSRATDVAAKRVLGRWNARVFLTPCRGAVKAATYPEANARSRELSGKGLSKQAWNILPKVREMDAYLLEGPPLPIRECHPEICFWGLGGEVIAESKKSEVGQAKRLAVLSRHIPDAASILADGLERWPRKVVAADDLIDAMVCAVTAAGVWDGSLHTLPEFPERDERGLAMEMVYRVPR